MCKAQRGAVLSAQTVAPLRRSLTRCHLCMRVVQAHFSVSRPQLPAFAHVYHLCTCPPVTFCVIWFHGPMPGWLRRQTSSLVITFWRLLCRPSAASPQESLQHSVGPIGDLPVAELPREYHTQRGNLPLARAQGVL